MINCIKTLIGQVIEPLYMQGPNPLGPILISVLKLGSKVTKGVSQTKWYQ